MTSRKKISIAILICVILLFVIVQLYNNLPQYLAGSQTNYIPGTISTDSVKYPALLDKEFSTSSRVTINGLDENTINNLSSLGKLWGFLKYYHPTVATGRINWDFELFRILPKVLNCRTKQERNNIFIEWVKVIGPLDGRQEPNTIAANEIKILPDLQWTEDSIEYGSELVNSLQDIRYAKRERAHFYLDFTSKAGNPIFANENAYAAMYSPDTGYRLLSLFRYWNMIQYLFPYKYLIEEDWKKTLTDFIPKFVNAEDALEYRLAVITLVAKINDGHAQISSYEHLLTAFHGSNVIPCTVEFVENKLLVTEVPAKFASTLLLKAGDIVEKINNETVSEMVKRKSTYYSASNMPSKLSLLAYDILRSAHDSVTVTYTRGKKTISCYVQCINFNDYAFGYSGTIKKRQAWKMLKGNIGYIYPGELKNSALSGMMNTFKECKGLIIDLRCYPLENICYTLAEYLMPNPIAFVKFTGTNFYSPGLFLFSSPLTVGKNNSGYFKGKVVILVNELTGSNAEFTAMSFRKAPNAIVIGSTTAGADGNVSKLYLPGGILTGISGIGVYYPDGTETQCVGIKPDIEIKPTVQAKINGTDEVLEKAIELIHKSK